MEKHKKKIINISIVFIAIVILLFIISKVFDNRSSSNNLVAQKESMLAAQRNAEDKFDLDGYSIDNPNVILDPYDNSPLSALIIFDTIDEVAPKITIVGKDESTSFVHEFEKATKHILPIYGLYPDTNNRVIIEYEDVKETIRKPF